MHSELSVWQLTFATGKRGKQRKYHNVTVLSETPVEAFRIARGHVPPKARLISTQLLEIGKEARDE